MLSLGLLLARDLLGAALPERASQKAQSDPVVKELVGEVRERLFKHPDDIPDIFEESLFHPFYVKMRERLRDKARYSIRTVVTPGVDDWEHTSLPDLLFPLYLPAILCAPAGAIDQKVWTKSDRASPMIEKIPTRVIGAWEKSTFRAYMAALIGLMSWKVVLALALMVCVSLVEGVGLLMLVPILGLVGLDVQQGSVGQISDVISSIFTFVGIRPTLISALGIYVLVISLYALLNRWQTTASLNLQHQFVGALRRQLYEAIADSNWLFFSRSRSSDFTHALTTELDRVGGATHQLLSMSATAIVASVYLLLALQISIVMSGMVLACGAVLWVLLKRKTQAGRLTGEQISLALNGLYAAAIEHLGGMKTAKSYGAEKRNVDIFSRLADRITQMQVVTVRNQAQARFWFEVGAVVILSFILYVSLQLLGLPVAGVLLLLFLFARVMPQFSMVQQNYCQFINLLPAFATVMKVQARCEAAAEPKVERPGKVELHHGIRFEEVSFGYEGEGGDPVVRDLNLTVRAGETTAIVGPSGAGKSTIADLVMGLIVPDRGRVLVDGKPLGAELVRSWRGQIGYVAQDTFLFHDTVRANLLWACPDADDGEIQHALRLAAAEEFVSELPDGMETVLGDRGVRLSGGERQRLALARALLRRPSLLILDEATSSLDSENEKRIQNAVEELQGHMTILIITHRLSTIRGADVIYVLERGRLVETGDWATLIGTEGGRFRTMCEVQGVFTNEVAVGNRELGSG